MPTHTDLPTDTAGTTCVSRVPIFGRLDAAQQAAVAGFARPVHVARGDLLHAAGDELGRLFVVHSGRVKLVHVWPDGREHLIRVVEPGDYVGERAFLTGERTDYHAQALSDAQLCVFAHADLERLVATYPGIALALVHSLSDRAAEAERRVALTGVAVDARLARYLLDLADPGGSDPVVRLPLSKRDVAAYLGTTPESLSRALARLQREGVIAVDGRRIALSDVDRLADWGT